MLSFTANGIHENTAALCRCEVLFFCRVHDIRSDVAKLLYANQVFLHGFLDMVHADLVT